MRWEGHVGIAFILFAPVAFASSYAGYLEPLALSLAGLVFGATVPDIDLEVGFLDHWGSTHTVFAGLGLGLCYGAAAIFLYLRGPLEGGIVDVLLGVSLAVALGFGAVVSHLLGDVITPMGIRPFYPLSDAHYSLGLVLSNNERANRGLLSAGSVSMVGGITAGVYYAGGPLPI